MSRPNETGSMLLVSLKRNSPGTYGIAASGRFARKKLELPSVSRLHPGWVNNLPVCLKGNRVQGRQCQRGRDFSRGVYVGSAPAGAASWPTRVDPQCRYRTNGRAWAGGADGLVAAVAHPRAALPPSGPSHECRCQQHAGESCAGAQAKGVDIVGQVLTRQ
jgi:hypothetical protein